MNRFNLTEWAIRHRSLVIYFMLVIVAAGIGSYLRLGRSEDPDFTVKTMVVQVGWPGATVSDTLQQITDRLERKLEETPNLDYLKSYTTAGQATVFVNLKDSTPAAQVPDIWYQVRKKVDDIRGALPQGIVGPGFNDEFGDTYGIVYGFTADGFTHRELRDTVDDVRKQLLELPDISKIDVLGAQDERVYVEFSTEQLAGLGIDRAALIAALEAQNAVTPQGVVQTGDEKILVRVSGAFRSERDILAVNFVANGRMIRLGDIARVTRGPADPAQPMFRVNGKEGIGLAIAMRKGGDVLALGRNVEHAMTEIKANLPVGIEPTLVADQPVTVEHAVADFMEALWEAIAIVLGVSLIALGVRAGAVVALSIPLVLAVVFVTMSAFGIDLQRISLGALIIALGLLVDDAMITIESMVTRLERGDEKEQAAKFAYSSTAFPRLAGTLVTIAAFVPIGFAHSAAGEYTFSIFAVVAIALIGSWCVAALFTPMLGVWVLKKPKTAHPEQPGPIMRAFRSVPRAGDASPLDHDRRDPRPVRRGGLWNALRSAAILSGVRSTRAPGGPAAAGERVHLRDQGRLGPSGQAPEGRSGRRSLEHLCRAGRGPVLPAPERAAPERLFRAGRGRHQGTRAARTREGEARESAGGRFPERRRSGLPVWSSARRSDGRSNTG